MKIRKRRERRKRIEWKEYSKRKAKKNKEWKEYSERKAKRIKSGRTIVRERELKNRMNLKENRK